MKAIESFDDIFADDTFDLLDDNTDLFDFKHTPKDDDRVCGRFRGKKKINKEI